MGKIIIDTDPGVDDALAIMLACSAKLDLAGITTVYGNSDLENTTNNALTVLELMKNNIPVSRGADKPFLGRGKLARSHGTNGLGGFKLDKLQYKTVSQTATEFLAEQFREGRKTIISLGPLTNLAIFIKCYPQLVKKIEQIIILGGVLNERGNISPFAEFNVYNDPFALKIVLDTNCSKVLIPIDVCRKVYFLFNDFKRINNIRLQKSLQKITQIYIDYYQSNKKYGSFKGGVMYDLLAVAYYLKPALFKIKRTNIDVCLKGSKFGQTYELLGDANCDLVFDVEAKQIKELFFSVVNNAVL